jgi:hypothetical protein
MKTQDIKNMASAYMQVLEKAKMDKVNPKALEKDFDDREDKDIDNDGDTDKSDEYLHNRRKAVKNAMKKEAVSNMGKKPSDTQMGTITVTTDAERAKRAQAYRDKQASMKKEEVEELDEISRDTARSYISKASAHKTTGETPKKDRSSGVELAGKKAYGIGGKPKVMATEEVEELDELSIDKLKDYHSKAGAERDRDIEKERLSGKRASGKDLDRQASRIRGLNTAANKIAKKQISAIEKDRADRAKKSMKNEEIENLDELSKKTLGSYIKKATGDAMTKSFKAGDVRDKDSTDNRLKAMGRQMGIAKATNKLTKEEVDLDEAAPKMKPDFIKTQREKDRAHDDAMGRTPTGRKKTMSSTQRSMASMRKEDTDMSMREKLQLQKESILEREMTDAEKKKREDIVMGMKKNKADLEKRYGSRWKDVMYATATKQAMESVDNALAMTKNLLTTKESFNTETTTWPVYARIKENRAMQTKGATPPETMNDKMTASDKAFIAPHGSLDGIDSGIDGAKAAEYTAKHATDGIKPGAGMNRPNDQKTGDKKIMDNFVRKIREAYAEMLEKQNSEISEISQQAKKNYLKKAIGSDDDYESPSMANLKVARKIPQKHRDGHSSPITAPNKNLDKYIANRKKGIERATGSAEKAKSITKSVDRFAKNIDRGHDDTNINKGMTHLSKARKKAGLDK